MERDTMLSHIKKGGVCVAMACAMIVCYLVGLLPPSGTDSYPRTAGLVTSAMGRKWDLLTFIFCEPHLLLVTVDVTLVLVFGPIVEQSMGRMNFVRYVVCVAVSTGVCSILCVLMVSVFVGGENARRSVHCGGWVAAELVMVGFAAESMAASTTVSTPILPKIRAQQWPYLIWLLSCAVSLLGVVLPTNLGNGYAVVPPFLVCGLGFWVAWAFQRFACGQTVPSFAFHMFFSPAPVRGVVRSAGASLYRLCGRDLDEGAAERAGASASVLVRTDATSAGDGVERVLLPGSTPEEADRRRAVALAALANRIHQQREQAPASSFPPRPSQRTGPAPAAPAQEPDDDHKENAEV